MHPGPGLTQPSIFKWSVNGYRLRQESLRQVCATLLGARHVPERLCGRLLESDAWFPPFRCRADVAVSPLPLRKFRKTSVSAVHKNYVAYLTNSVAPLPCQLPFCRSYRPLQIGSKPTFAVLCRSWTANQSSGHFIPTDMERRFQQFRSRAQRQRQLRNGTEERQRCNGTSVRKRKGGNYRRETADSWCQNWCRRSGDTSQPTPRIAEKQSVCFRGCAKGTCGLIQMQFCARLSLSCSR